MITTTTIHNISSTAKKIKLVLARNPNTKTAEQTRTAAMRNEDCHTEEFQMHLAWATAIGAASGAVTAAAKKSGERRMLWRSCRLWPPSSRLPSRLCRGWREIGSAARNLWGRAVVQGPNFGIAEAAGNSTVGKKAMETLLQDPM